MAAIPKVIHYCWFGGNPIPEKDRKCIESWKKYCPDYEIIQWDESNYNITKNIYCKQAYEAKRWAFASDFARLDIIFTHGGVYFDTDVELIKNIDVLLENEAFSGIDIIQDYCWVSTGLGFGGKKNSEIILRMRDCYNNINFIDDNGNQKPLLTPILITNMLKNYGFNEKNEFQNIMGLSIYPSEYFSPKRFDTGQLVISDNTYSIHHYHASWKTKNEIRIAKRNENATKFLGKKWGERYCAILEEINKKGVGAAIKKVFQKLHGN